MVDTLRKGGIRNLDDPSVPMFTVDVRGFKFNNNQGSLLDFEKFLFEFQRRSNCLFELTGITEWLLLISTLKSKTFTEGDIFVSRKCKKVAKQQVFKSIMHRYLSNSNIYYLIIKFSYRNTPFYNTRVKIFLHFEPVILFICFHISKKMFQWAKNFIRKVIRSNAILFMA